MAEDDVKLITKFIRDQVEAAGAEGAVLGISGGLDSATVAFLAARALGKDRVFALLLPEVGMTPEAEVEDAREVASILKIDAKEIDISQVLRSYFAVLPAEAAPAVVNGNLKARVRMTILYWHA
ncbi:MAG TPA: NAD(+) synthase, partial [Methanothrix sp.]|nr:NAD(+) synthase [Methanothrix sp.]HQA62121.1 NAD(+) synthase [Methanothrix sp.]